MQELDIRTLLSVLMQKLKWILTVTLIVAILFGSYTYFMVADTYRSSFSMYVSNITTVLEGQAISSSGLATSQALVQEYISLLRTDLFVDEVAANLRRQGYVLTNKTIRSIVSLSSPTLVPPIAYPGKSISINFSAQ